jgi:hypothetical protein
MLRVSYEMVFNSNLLIFSRDNINPPGCTDKDHHFTMHTLDKPQPCGLCAKYLKGSIFQVNLPLWSYCVRSNLDHYLCAGLQMRTMLIGCAQGLHNLGRTMRWPQQSSATNFTPEASSAFQSSPTCKYLPLI